MLAYWKPNETSGSTTVGDSSGAGNTGTVNGGVTLGYGGKLNTAALFKGTTGYISSLSPATTKSISFWLNISTTVTNMGLFSMGTESAGQVFDGYLFKPAGASPCPNSTDYGFYLSFHSNDTAAPCHMINSGSWNQIVVSWSGGTSVTVGINGVFPPG